MSTRRPARPRSRLGIAVGVLGCIGFLCGFALALQRRDLAERWLLARAREAGLAAPSLHVERLDWGVVELRDLRAADDALSIAGIEARFDVDALLGGPLRELRARGVELRGEAGALVPLLESLGALLGGADPVARWERLEVESSRLVLETALGRLDATGSGRATQVGDDAVEGELLLEATRGALRGSVALSGSATPEGLVGDLRLELLAAGSFAAGSLEAGHLSAELGVRGRPEAVQLVLRECAKLRIQGLRLGPEVALVSPLRACLGEPEQTLLEIVASPSDERSLEGALEVPPVRFDLELGEERTPAEGETPRLSVALTGSPELPTLTIASRRGSLEAPALGLELRDLDASLEWSQGSGVAARGRLAQLLDVSESRRLPRLGLTLELGRESGATSFELHLSDDARDLVLDLVGRAPGGGESTRADLSLQPVVLGRDGVELLRLLPGLEDAEADGTLAALGSLSRSQQGFVAGVEVALRDLALSSSLVSVEGVNGVVRLEGPSPFSIPPGQLISVARLDFGLELVDGVARFAVGPEGALTLEESEWTLAGGHTVARGSLDPTAEEPLVLSVERARVAELFGLLDLAVIGGEGEVSGEMALVRRDGGLVLESASFASVGEGGWIRYRPEPEQPEEVGAALDPRAEALASFRYDELELAFAGALPGSLDVSVVLRGANPDLGELSPTELHFTVPGALEPRPGAASPGHVVPEEVEERLASFEDRLRAGPER